MTYKLKAGDLVREINWMGQHPRNEDLKIDKVAMHGSVRRVEIHGLWDDATNYRLVGFTCYKCGKKVELNNAFSLDDLNYRHTECEG